MAKGKSDPLDENDYIEQLQWQAKRQRRMPVRFEPKWKYKIVYRYPKTSLAGRVMQFLMVVLLLFFMARAVSFNVLTENIIGTVIVGGILLLISLIFFFAVSDGLDDKDEEDIDS